MSENGRVTFPVQFRKELGLERGGDVIIELADGELRVRTVASVMARARSLARQLVTDKQGSSVNDFLADRREAEREA
jgi:bifunctional DNA-binding transcriptional regulator/antitoxin component of YhaV-PrlF toxin-antitoxin module